MTDRPSVLRETDEEALRLARNLLRSARHAALAVIDAESGFPFSSRTLLATDYDGVPVLLVSTLATHTKALLNDARASLLTGEPGKGDPLAHPRMTTQCRAVAVDRASPDHRRLRHRFLGRHPKAALYVDFGDFCFFRLEPQWASLNAGFGRAYRIAGEDLMIRSPANAVVAEHIDEIVEKLYRDHPDLANIVAAESSPEAKDHWRIAGIDCAGIDVARGDFLIRREWDMLAMSLDETYSTISKIACVSSLRV